MMATDKKANGKPKFSAFECEVVEGVVNGKTIRRIAFEQGMSVGHVGKTVGIAAAKVPGPMVGKPSYRLYRWYWDMAGGSTEAIVATR